MFEILLGQASIYRDDFSSRFDTAVIVRNPHNDFADEKAKQTKAEIEHLFQDVIIEDSAEDVSGHKDLVRYYDSPSGRTLWIPTGGDGTFSNLAGAKPRSPILINKAGYANDAGHMASGILTHLHPEKTIKKGKIAALRPIEITSKTLDGSKPVTELAFGYYGIGLSGQVAKNMNSGQSRSQESDKHPLSRHFNSGKLILDTLKIMPSFEVTENGESQTRFELLFVNGQRMARVFRFLNLQLFEPEAGRIELLSSRQTDFVTVMGKAALYGDFDRLDRFTNYNFSVKSDEPIVSQRDGEFSEHASGTSFSVKLSDYSAKILTSRW